MPIVRDICLEFTENGDSKMSKGDKIKSFEKQREEWRTAAERRNKDFDDSIRKKLTRKAVEKYDEEMKAGNPHPFEAVSKSISSEVQLALPEVLVPESTNSNPGRAEWVPDAKIAVEPPASEADRTSSLESACKEKQQSAIKVEQEADRRLKEILRLSPFIDK